MNAYLTLTKPRISFLVAITGLAALIVEGSLLRDPLRLGIIVLALFLTAGSANAFNQYFEREVDKKMARTAAKRPLPLGVISERAALGFSFIVGTLGVAALWFSGTAVAAILGLATILFYALYYTLWLKPRTPYNIVIGGAAGAMGPVIAWTAVTGGLSWAAVIMFLIIFMWTPPHFWALALCCKDDYRTVNYPMLPLVKGDGVTCRQIVAYSWSLPVLAVLLYFLADFGRVYLSGAVILSALFVLGAHRLARIQTIRICWQFFGYSIVYLLFLFLLMIADAVLK